MRQILALFLFSVLILVSQLGYAQPVFGFNGQNQPPNSTSTTGTAGSQSGPQVLNEGQFNSAVNTLSQQAQSNMTKQVNNSLVKAPVNTNPPPAPPPSAGVIGPQPSTPQTSSQATPPAPSQSPSATPPANQAPATPPVNQSAVPQPQAVPNTPRQNQVTRPPSQAPAPYTGFGVQQPPTQPGSQSTQSPGLNIQY